ncbi:MAG: TetR/AcrR family transcriptional regulator [Chloroflexota bacterium]
MNEEGSTSHRQNSDSVDRIVRIASTLFAEHGFHGVTTREIAAAVGLNIATVHYHVGTKEELYREVFRRFNLPEAELFKRFRERVDDGVTSDALALRELLYWLVDELVNLLLQQPDRPRLWMRRWLEKPGQFEQIEAQLALPLYKMVDDILEKAAEVGTIQPKGLDLQLFQISFTWILYGFFTRGPLYRDSSQEDTFSQEDIDNLKQFLKAYVSRMLGLP